MHSPAVRDQALQLVRSGLNDCEVARRTGISRTTIRDWRRPRYVRRHLDDIPSRGHVTHDCPVSPLLAPCLCLPAARSRHEAHPSNRFRGLAERDCRTRAVAFPEGPDPERRMLLHQSHRPYEYLSYQFSNHSPDILGLFCWTCDLVGLEYRRYAQAVRINRRGSVARLKDKIGVKR